MNKNLKQIKRKLVKLANMDTVYALKIGASFLNAQVKIRPRLRLGTKLIFVLVIALILSNLTVAFLKSRTKEINQALNLQPGTFKNYQQTLLVAQESQTQTLDPQFQISQSLTSKLSPFEFRKPVSGYISQGYSAYHRANDITDSLGAPIHPVGNGVVEFAGYTADGKGNIVIVNHGDGLSSLYAHVGTINVSVGNTITADTTLGTVGLTGHTTGPHVHLEIYDHENPIDPESILPEDNSTSS